MKRGHQSSFGHLAERDGEMTEWNDGSQKQNKKRKYQKNGNKLVKESEQETELDTDLIFSSQLPKTQTELTKMNLNELSESVPNSSKKRHKVQNDSRETFFSDVGEQSEFVHPSTLTKKKKKKKKNSGSFSSTQLSETESLNNGASNSGFSNEVIKKKKHKEKKEDFEESSSLNDGVKQKNKKLYNRSRDNSMANEDVDFTEDLDLNEVYSQPTDLTTKKRKIHKHKNDVISQFENTFAESVDMDELLKIPFTGPTTPKHGANISKNVETDSNVTYFEDATQNNDGLPSSEVKSVSKKKKKKKNASSENLVVEYNDSNETYFEDTTQNNDGSPSSEVKSVSKKKKKKKNASSENLVMEYNDSNETYFEDTTQNNDGLPSEVKSVSKKKKKKKNASLENVMVECNEETPKTKKKHKKFKEQDGEIQNTGKNDASSEDEKNTNFAPRRDILFSGEVASVDLFKNTSSRPKILSPNPVQNEEIMDRDVISPSKECEDIFSHCFAKEICVSSSSSVSSFSSKNSVSKIEENENSVNKQLSHVNDNVVVSSKRARINYETDDNNSLQKNSGKKNSKSLENELNSETVVSTKKSKKNNHQNSFDKNKNIQNNIEISEHESSLTCKQLKKSVHNSQNSFSKKNTHTVSNSSESDSEIDTMKKNDKDPINSNNIKKNVIGSNKLPSQSVKSPVKSCDIESENKVYPEKKSNSLESINSQKNVNSVEFDDNLDNNSISSENVETNSSHSESFEEPIRDYEFKKLINLVEPCKKNKKLSKDTKRSKSTSQKPAKTLMNQSENQDPCCSPRSSICASECSSVADGNLSSYLKSLPKTKSSPQPSGNKRRQQKASLKTAEHSQKEDSSSSDDELPSDDESLEILNSIYERCAKAAQHLQDFEILEDFDVHAEHMLETNVLYNQRFYDDIKKKLVDMKMKLKGKFSLYEDRVILTNWNNFCEKYKLDKEEAALVFTRLCCEIAKSCKSIKIQNNLPMHTYVLFARYLGQGLPKKTLRSIYHRYKLLVDPFCKVKGYFRPFEDDLIMKYRTGNIRLSFMKIAMILNRDRASVAIRFARISNKDWITSWSREQNRLSEVRRINMKPSARMNLLLLDTEELEGQIRLIMKYSKCYSVSDLRRIDQSKIPWSKINKANKFKGHLARKLWYYNLYTVLHIKEPTNIRQVDYEIVKCLRKMKNVKCLTEVDWPKLTSKSAPGFHPIHVARIFHNVMRHGKALNDNFTNIPWTEQLDELYDIARNRLHLCSYIQPLQINEDGTLDGNNDHESELGSSVSEDDSSDS